MALELLLSLDWLVSQDSLAWLVVRSIPSGWSGEAVISSMAVSAIFHMYYYTGVLVCGDACVFGALLTFGCVFGLPLRFAGVFGLPLKPV